MSEVTMTFSVTIIIIIIVAFNDTGEVTEWCAIFFTEIFAVNPQTSQRSSLQLTLKKTEFVFKYLPFECGKQL